MPISLHSDNLNSPLVAPLAQFDRGSLALAGGKGANLGELIKAGFDVPSGFIITTTAYVPWAIILEIVFFIFTLKVINAQSINQRKFSLLTPTCQ